MAIKKAKSASTFKKLPSPKSVPVPGKKAVKSAVKSAIKKSAPKYDDRTGSMTGAPSFKQLQDKKYMASMATKANRPSGMTMLKKAFKK